MSKFGDYQTPSSESDWRKPLLRKTWLFIIIFLALGAVPLFIEAWPGCFVSVVAFATAIALMVFSFIIINVREEGNYKKNVKVNASNMLYVILACGFFWGIATSICWLTECEWWILLIVAWIGVGLLVFPIAVVEDLRENAKI